MVAYQHHWNEWVDEEPKQGSSWSQTDVYVTKDASEIKEAMFDIEQNTTSKNNKLKMHAEIPIFCAF